MMGAVIKPLTTSVWIVMINDFPAAVGSTKAEAERLMNMEATRMNRAGRARGAPTRHLHGRIWEFKLDKLDSGAGV